MTISVRIVHLDHYMSQPGPLDRSYSPFSNKKLLKVPIIRIFGSTMSGQKICIHIHQVYPYFYVPYKIPEHCTTEKEIQKDIFQFGTSLNEAINLAKPDEKLKDQHIVAIVLTKGIPFYGYHAGYTKFLKIYITNPQAKQQMLDILQTSAIQNTRFQPYEAHLNFELQFLMDHNLFGMDWLHIDDRHGIVEGSEEFGIRFRLPLMDNPKTNVYISQSTDPSGFLPDFYSKDTNASFAVYTSKTIPIKLQSNEVPRESYCELELDITSVSILNRHDIKERDIHRSIASDIKYNAQQKQADIAQKLVNSLDTIWKDELRRRKARGLEDPSIPNITQVTDRQPTSQLWSTEKALRHVMEKYMFSDVAFDINKQTQESSEFILDIMTSFQSVEALFPESYFTFLSSQENKSGDATPLDKNALVTPISNLLQVASTPSRYRIWDLPSQLDRSILNSFIEDFSFHTDEKMNEMGDTDRSQSADEETENMGSNKDKDDEEDEFSLEDDLNNSDLAQWLEETEKKINSQSKSRHVAIEYEDQTFHPRKLDFIAETQKMDDILIASQNQEKGNVKKEILDFYEDEDDDDLFQISDIPPEPMVRIFTKRKRVSKQRHIDQLDGSKDSGQREARRHKTAEERWEEERSALRQMRLKRKKDQQQKKDSQRELQSLPSSIQKRDSLKEVQYFSSSMQKKDSQKKTRSLSSSVHMTDSQKKTKPSSSSTQRKDNQKELRSSTQKKMEYKSFGKDVSDSDLEMDLEDPERYLQKVRVIVPLFRPKKKRKIDTNVGYSALLDQNKTLEPLEHVWSIDSTLPVVKKRRQISLSKSKNRFHSFPSSLTVHSSKKRSELSPVIVIKEKDEYSSQRNESNSPKKTENTEAYETIIEDEITELSDQYDSLSQAKVSIAKVITENDSKENIDNENLNLNVGPSVEEITPAIDPKNQPTISSFHSVPDNTDYGFSDLNDFQDFGSSPFYCSQKSTIAINVPTQHDALLESSHTVPFGFDQSLIKKGVAPEFSLAGAQEQPKINVIKEFIYNQPPPIISRDYISTKSVVYQEPYYNDRSDAPKYPVVFAGKEFKLPVKDNSTLDEFQTAFSFETTIKTQIKSWAPAKAPPSLSEVKEWMKTEEFKITRKQKKPRSQLANPSSHNTFNFKSKVKKPQLKVKKIQDHLDYFSLEIHVNTRELLLPDPEQDPVQLIFWCLQTEDQNIISNGYQEGYHIGVIAMNHIDIKKIGLTTEHIDVNYAKTEIELFTLLIERVRYYDPDLLVGYEVQNASWGYLVDRGAQLGLHLLDELARFRITSQTIKRDQWGYQKGSVYKVPGRHMLNVWRLMKHDLTLTSYTIENVAYHLLHHRIPHFSYATLTQWYTEGGPVLKYRLFKYFMKRVQLNLDMLDISQVIDRTCESARVYGIDFYAVLTRGSQYDVESIMFRIAKPENFILISPSRQQVGAQRSLECLPLVMEPETQFYSSPLVVLDFQSLYPSIMIAYNYCYSTCLGRVRKPDESSRFGVLNTYEPEEGLLYALKDQINLSPNGIMYVKPEIRKSTLAKMLEELLDTRVMVKRAMKDYIEDPGLFRLLNAKQLTLKLLANVTYGYTSASFSGRMPSVEIGDSIVSTARETLERAIQLINSTEKWGARVVYGDTDSVFVYFPGKSREDAFKLGHEIADAVTRANPDPIKLKFEKVYHPAILLAKKRYVGFKYEHVTDTEPVLEAKGIETVRRDGTAATQKILESSLKILFRTQDMSQLKKYLYEEWTKILSNRVLVKEFIIAKGVRMGTYSSRGGPNGAIVAQAKMNVDARAEPQYGERVPYVVVYRGPNAKLKDKVVRPEVLLNSNSLKLDAEYYIRKQVIPPLSRVFNLIGVDILSWYESMPRSTKIEAMSFAQTTEDEIKKISRIDQYYSSSHCLVCRKLTHRSICESCSLDVSNTVYTLTARQQQADQRLRNVLKACQDCSKVNPLDTMISVEGKQYADVPCDSLDCEVLYERLKIKRDVKILSNYNRLIENILNQD